MRLKRLGLGSLLALMATLLLWQSIQMASALWLVRSDAFAVSGFLWGALAFKGVLLLLNLGVIAVLCWLLLTRKAHGAP